MRIELDGDWAELRPPNKIPHGITMEYRDAFFEATTIASAAVSSTDDAKKVGVAYMQQGGLAADQRQTNAFIIAIVKEWSYGPVDAKTLLEVPTSDLDTILDQADVDAYRKVLNPEFGDAQDREPGSPT